MSLLLLDLLAALLRRRWRLRLDLGLVLLAALLWGRLEVLLLLKPSCDQTLSSMWPDVINVTRYYLFVVLLLDLLLLVGLGLDVLLLLLGLVRVTLLLLGLGRLPLLALGLERLKTDKVIVETKI